MSPFRVLPNTFIYIVSLDAVEYDDGDNNDNFFFWKWKEEAIEKKQWFELDPPNSKCQRQGSIQSRLQASARMHREVFYQLHIFSSDNILVIFSLLPLHNTVEIFELNSNNFIN